MLHTSTDSEIMRSLLRSCCVVALCLLAHSAVAQTYPSHPIRMVVGFPPGGATDLVARAVGERLSEALGQPVVIDNRGGAGGTIGSDVVAKAAPDGYTLLMAAGAFSIAPSLYVKLPYDSVADFTPVGLVAKGAFMLVANPSLPAKSVAEVVALARAKPGTLNFASTGVGASPHLAGELLNSMAGIHLVHVPYKGDSAALADLTGGRVELAIMSISASTPLAAAGRLRPLAVTSAQRSKLAPDVPTVGESGVPGYELTTWWGVLAPAKTPREIVTRINAALERIASTPEFRERLATVGVEAEGSTPEAFGALIQREIEKNARLVKAAGIKPE